MNRGLLSRRDFLRYAGAGGAGLAGLYLAGCGDGGGGGASPTATGAATAPVSPTDTPVPLAWRDITPSGIQPPPRRDHSLVTDGERLYLFGGRNDGVDLQDLWAYDIAAEEWSELAPVGPSARFGHNAVWTSESRMIVFGGQAGSEFFNDVWMLDPAANAWSELPRSGGPEARYGAGGCYDPDGHLLITHGFTANGRFDDTWSYDMAAGSWTDVSPADERPVERCLMRAVWDTLRGRILLFGGQTNGTPFLDDLWSLQPGSTRGWAQLERDPKPSPRTFYSMVFDGDANKLIIFGGNTEDGPTNDLWYFDAQNEFWTRMNAEGLPPSPRVGHDAVWLPGRQSLVVFGGSGSGGDLNDLWELARTS